MDLFLFYPDPAFFFNPDPDPGGHEYGSNMDPDPDFSGSDLDLVPNPVPDSGAAV